MNGDTSRLSDIGRRGNGCRSLLGLLDFALCLGRLHDLAFGSKEERMLAVY
ncbi:MAG: hypothetical protein GX604_05095 [Actinobacteria bacterium]|nr:hypothetical protein [Actinomycetota bacterium]